MAARFPSGIFKALSIVFKNLFRPNITIMYPHEKWNLPERARWAVEMKYDEDGAHKCTACQICEKTCPDFIIEIDITVGEDRTKHINHWRYQRGACMMCGLCVEACPFDAIKMGHDYELAHVDPALKMFDLLTDTDAAKPKRKEPAASAVKPEPAASAAKPEPAASDTTPEAKGGEGDDGNS